VIFALFRVAMPHHGKREERGMESFLLGIRYVREHRTVGKMILTMATFSFLSLPFVGLFPAVARLNLHINEKSTTYKWLYATWGFGAMLGALAVGTVLVAHDKRILVRQTFFSFAICMFAFALSPNTVFAFCVVFVLGASYFSTTTSLMTVMQARLDPTIRARVLALWFMAFGGTVPLGNMVFGPVMDSIGPRPVLFLSAGWALFLAWWCNIKKADDRAGYFATI
jgi:predicted MFS family arabinose efflux permease